MKEKSRFRFLFFCSLVAALGGFLFGFDTAVISGTTEDLRRVFGLTSEFWLGFTVASALIGTILGALAAGRPADRLGRRNSLYYVGVLYFVSALGSAWPLDWLCGSGASWGWFLFFRFIGGIGVGASSVIAPTYIAEISPAKMRGRLVALTQFNIVLGIAAAYFSNYVITAADVGADAWRWMFAVEAVPAALFFFALFLTPESPRWLVGKGRRDEASKIFARLGVASDALDDEIRAVERSLEADRENEKAPFFQRANAKPILLAFAIAAFNQLSGINAIMYYAPTIFEKAGFAENAAFLSAAAIGVVNIVFTMLALFVIDSFGRRKLMLVGSIGYLVSLAAIACCFYRYGTEFDQTGGAIVFGSLILFIASHAFGQGAVIWVFISEIFPNRFRARGQAFGSFVHWVGAAGISWTFPMIAAASGGHAFAFYAVAMVGQLIWVLKTMPETKNISLEDLQKKLRGETVAKKAE